MAFINCVYLMCYLVLFQNLLEIHAAALQAMFPFGIEHHSPMINTEAWSAEKQESA